MRIRLQAVVAVLAGLTLLVLSAAPASANTKVIDLVSGQLDLYPPFAPLAGSVPLAVCPSGGTATATGTSSGTVTVTFTALAELIDPFGGTADYVMTLVVTLTGTYTGSGSSITITSGDATATIRALSANPCAPTGGVLCTIEADDLVGSGAMTGGTLPTMDRFDTASLAVGNSDFETAVAGSSCGGFVGVDSGHVELVATIMVF